MNHSKGAKRHKTSLRSLNYKNYKAKHFLYKYHRGLFYSARHDHILLAHEESAIYIREYQNGNMHNFDILFRSHNLMIILISARLAMMNHSFYGPESFDELLSRAYTIYYTCLKNYSYEYRFSTYFYSSLYRHLYSDEDRVLTDKKHTLIKLTNYIDNAKSENYNSTIHDILPDTTIRKLWACHRRIFHDELNENIIDKRYINDKINPNEELIEAILHALKMLSVRSRDVLLRRANGETLIDIGIAYELSRERIRQIESKAIRTIQISLRELYRSIT